MLEMNYISPAPFCKATKPEACHQANQRRKYAKVSEDKVDAG
jgi:hypothetical protein